MGSLQSTDKSVEKKTMPEKSLESEKVLSGGGEIVGKAPGTNKLLIERTVSFMVLDGLSTNFDEKYSEHDVGLRIGKEYLFQNKLENMEKEERSEFCSDIRAGMKIRRLQKLYDVDEDFILWAKKELDETDKPLTKSQLNEIRRAFSTGNLSAKEIAILKNIDEKRVIAAINDIMNPKTGPFEDSFPLSKLVVNASGQVIKPGWDANIELPQYLLNCDSVQIMLDQNNYIQKSHPNGRLSRLYDGECSCASENHNVLNFIVVGQTGTGKTTLIDTYVNYLIGITQYDKFRYRLIDEEGMKMRIIRKRQKQNKSIKVGCSDSVTSAVTIYHIKSAWIKNHVKPNVRACINIIDTPGFGDTRGIKWDRLIYEMIEVTLKNLKMLNYVLLVTKSSDTRLGASTKFVFQSIQNLWAKDISNRILVMYTFSDGKAPLAEQALSDEGIKTERGFKFNNSAIWQSSNDSMVTMFFNLCYSNYREFNEFIANQNLPAVSLRLTQGVLDMRKTVEIISIEAARQCQALNKNMTTIKKKMQEVYANAEQINNNKNWTETIPKTDYQEKTHSHDITQCTLCDYSEGKGICHFGCYVGDDKEKCSAMDSTGMCMMSGCGHGHWVHKNTRTYYQAYVRYETHTVSAKKHLYDEAGVELDNVSKLIIKFYDELVVMTEQYEDCQKRIQDCNDFLAKNAMRKKAYYTTDFFKEQIEALKNEGDTLESEQQIKMLNQMLQRQDVIRTALHGKGKIKVDRALRNGAQDSDLEVQINKQMFLELRTQFQEYKSNILKDPSNLQEQKAKTWTETFCFWK